MHEEAVLIMCSSSVKLESKITPRSLAVSEGTMFYSTTSKESKEKSLRAVPFGSWVEVTTYSTQTP